GRPRGRRRSARRSNAATRRPLAPAGDGDPGPARGAARDQPARRGDEPAPAPRRPAAARHGLPAAPRAHDRAADRRPRGELPAVMPTTTLLDALPDKTVLGSLPAEVTGVAYDSRKVAAGALFVAIPG